MSDDKRDEQGKFVAGNSGRPIGSKNLASSQIRDTFQLLLSNNLEKIQDDLNELEAKDRIKLLLDLASFIIPKMKSVDLKADKAETITIDFNESIGWDETDDEN
jgi:hypothetical protein